MLGPSHPFTMQEQAFDNPPRFEPAYSPRMSLAEKIYWIIIIGEIVTILNGLLYISILGYS